MNDITTRPSIPDLVAWLKKVSRAAARCGLHATAVNLEYAATLISISFLQ